MLDERDLQAIGQILKESEQRIMKNVAILMDADVTPKFNLLAEGQQDILERLVPRSRMDDLEDEMKFLKSVVRQMSEEIQRLKKAN